MARTLRHGEVEWCERTLGNPIGWMMRFLGAIFVLALITIVFAFYSDVAMTRCKVGSFFAALGWCSPLGH
jgi:hypothetical protein